MKKKIHIVHPAFAFHTACGRDARDLELRVSHGGPVVTCGVCRRLLRRLLGLALFVALAACDVASTDLGHRFECRSTLVCDGQTWPFTGHTCADDPAEAADRWLDGAPTWLESTGIMCATTEIVGVTCAELDERCATSSDVPRLVTCAELGAGDDVACDRNGLCVYEGQHCLAGGAP